MEVPVRIVDLPGPGYARFTNKTLIGRIPIEANRLLEYDDGGTDHEMSYKQRICSYEDR